MKRSNLMLAAALTALPFAAFAQGMNSDAKPATKPTTTIGTTATSTDSKPIAGTEAAKTTPAEKTAETQGKPATVKSDAPVKNQAAVKSMHSNHTPAAAPTGTQVKQPETPKS